MDIQRLETFLWAAEHLSFSEAAKQLHITQPTISHHIKVLESELGVKLFDRTAPRLQLTEAGRSLLPWARKLIQDSHDLQEMAASMQEGVIGHLRIACSTTAGKYILPQLAARFSKRHPGVRVSILACTPDLAIPQVMEGEANLGVVSFEPHEESVECQPFLEDHVTLIVPANHPWGFRRMVEPEELLKENVIMREPASGTRRMMLSELAKYDISMEDLNIFLELGNAEAIVRTVAAGYGVSFVSTLASACPLDRGNIVEVEVQGLNLRRTIYMVRNKMEVSNRPQETFWSFIHDDANADLLRLPETITS
ncbi:MAG: selenium metabolism-associated LysR family transcriptional regulator [Anaerolineales bacterium]|jgi:DNA-binding transcriptional LysR family regulator